MGPQEDYIETVVTCEGDFDDPQLQDRLQHFQQRLESLLLEDGKKQLILKKVEPWNSVRVTFSIPRQAALRLKQLAEQGSASLRQLGVLGVQIQGDHLVSLTVATSSNQRAELIISTHDGPAQGTAMGSTQTVSVGTSFDPGMPSSSEEQGSPGPNMEVTRKNIEEYLRQGSLFNSILTPTCVPGPSGAGSSHDIFKASTSSDGNSFRINNIAVEGMPGPSGLSGFPERSAFLGSDSHGPGPMTVQQGVNAPVSGQRGPRVSAAQHSTLQSPKFNMTQQKQQQLQQLSGQATALPQTAALGYNMMGLPPPPPYPHGHGTGVANSVGRQGKRQPASSPLLINLLQTEPVAGSNNVMSAPSTEKRVKKPRRRKDKQTGATCPPDGQVTAQGAPSLPVDSDPVSSIVPPQTIPSQEEMSAVLHRRVSPVPLPSPRLGAGFTNSVPISADHGAGNEGFRDRNPSTASAALASLAQSQRSAADPEQFSGDTIINPYTGHMEPRDSASDLSPVKKDQPMSHKSSLTEGSRNETSVSGVSVNTQMSLAAAKADVRTGSSDSLRIGLDSFQPGATVPSSLREERPRGFPSSTITSVANSEYSLVSDSLFRQSPDAGHAKVTTASSSSTLPISAASHIYAQHPFGPSQPLSGAPHAAPQHSTHTHTLKARTPTVNGPVHLTPPPSSFPVSSGQLSSESRLQMPRAGLDGGLVDSLHQSSHRPRASMHGDVMHSVSVGHEVKVDDIGNQLTGDTGGHQPVTVSSHQSLTHKALPVHEIRPGAAPASTVAAQAQSDSPKLLNSSSTVASGVAQRLAAVSTTTASTASPAAIKAPSDGEDNNSNHSGISPVSTVAPAPSSLLDANGTKVENHDSGMGSSSERSDDTTPSEAGDGEFQTSVPTTETSATDSSSGKPSVVVQKTVVNCKKEATSSSDPHTITVGYVQMNPLSTDPYNKETKKYMASASPLIGDKSAVDDTLREVSNLIKSTSSLMPVASQVALAAHKDASVSLPLPAKINNLPHQQLVIKHKAAANSQVLEVHQNGPTSLQGQHLPSSTHATVHHSTGITISHHQGQGGAHHPPSSALNNQASHQPPVSVPNSQGYGGWHHQPSSVINSLGQGGHLPSAVHSQVVRTSLHPGSVPSGLPPGASPHLTSSVANEAVSASSLSAGHNSQSAAGLPFHNAVHVIGSNTALAKNKGHKIVGKDLPSPVSQGLHPLVNSGKPSASQAPRTASQGHPSHTSSATAPYRNVALHHMAVTFSHSQHTASPGSLGPHSSTVSPGTHNQGSGIQGAPSQVPVSHGSTSLVPVSQDSASQPPTSHTAGDKLAASLPSLLSSSSTSAVHKTTATHTLASTGPQPVSSLGSQPVSSSHKMIVNNALHSLIDLALDNSTREAQTTTAPGLRTSEGDQVKHVSANPSSVNTSVNITTGLDLASVASDLVADTSLGDFALLGDSNSHNDDVFGAEDLALITEPRLSAYLDMGVRHGTTNGNMGVSTETRAGVNITSMYTKRSSPINVNMLNHIYAAGLPQPRRLTESVQRLVKPLPNPENSLLPGRTCKSPSASSRHSSNGSASPGRASQGGSRSPGASITGASPARNLTFDKLTPNQSSAVHNSFVSAGSNSLASHMTHPTFGGSLNCVNTSVIPAAPHPLATLQSSASSRHKTGNGSAVPANVSVALSTVGVASAVAVSSLPAASSSSSALSSSQSVMPHTVTDLAVSSHNHGNGPTISQDSPQSRLQLNHPRYSVSGPVSKVPQPPAVSVHHPHSHPSMSINVAQPDLRQPESTAEDSIVSRVSSPAVSSLPSSVSAVCNRVAIRPSHQAVPPDPHASVSVCNTSRVENVTGKTSIHPPSNVPHPLLTSLSSVHHLSPSSLSSPVMCSSSSVVAQLHLPAACVSPTHQNSTVTSVSSSFDLSTHTSVVTAGHVHPASAATSSVCVSNMLAASTSAEFPKTPRLVSVGHSVTSQSQHGLAVTGRVTSAQGIASLNMTSSRGTSTEMRSEPTGQTFSSACEHSTVPSSLSDSLAKITNSGRILPQSSPPVTVDQRGTGVINTYTVGAHLSAKPSSKGSTSASSDSCVSKVPSMAENLSHTGRLKESDGEEKVSGPSATVPVSECSIQDSTPNSQCGQTENLHSKPPLLQPAPPLTLPTLIPSATPPPPPLTPVLLQDTGKKEVISNPCQAPLQTNMEGSVDGTATSGLQETRTTSPSFLGSDPAVGTEEHGAQEGTVGVQNSSSSKGVESGLRDNTSTHPISHDMGGPDPASQPLSANLSLEESNLRTRHLTRKRKSTNSESDSSSEPAPKLSCVECSVGNRSSVESSKASDSSDIPPKLYKEGRKTNVVEKMEEDKGGKKPEDKLTKEEEKGKKEEEKAGLKNMSHHDRNILDATPEEVAKKIAAAGSKRRVHYTYVLEKVTPGQSYFDTPVLPGRTRSQGSKGSKESSAPTGVTLTVSAAPAGSQMIGPQSVGAGKEDTGDPAAAGSKRSTRSLRTKGEQDGGESSQAKRKRSKEHR